MEMTELEKVIKEWESVLSRDPLDAPWDLIDETLAMLKEDCHNCKLECLLQKYDQLKEKYDKLLKEQETELCDRCGRRRLKSNREGQ
jgi:hypothetical protein